MAQEKGRLSVLVDAPLGQPAGDENGLARGDRDGGRAKSIEEYWREGHQTREHGPERSNLFGSHCSVAEGSVIVASDSEADTERSPSIEPTI